MLFFFAQVKEATMNGINQYAGFVTNGNPCARHSNILWSLAENRPEIMFIGCDFGGHVAQPHEHRPDGTLAKVHRNFITFNTFFSVLLTNYI